MSYPDTGESGETYDVEMKDYYLGVYWYGTLCCARPGCRCEFQTYHDMLQHLKTGVCGAMNWDPLIRRLPFSRKREDMQEILHQRRFASGVRKDADFASQNLSNNGSPRNRKVESGDQSQKVL